MPFFGGGGEYKIVGTNIKGGNDALGVTIGVDNMALGNGAFQTLVIGDDNLAIGNGAGQSVTEINGSIFIGSGCDTGESIGLGSESIQIGANAKTDRIRSSIFITPVPVIGSYSGSDIRNSVVLMNNGSLLNATNSVMINTRSVALDYLNVSGSVIIKGFLSYDNTQEVVVIGNDAQSDGDYSVAVGGGSYTGIGSVSVGRMAKAGDSTVAINTDNANLYNNSVGINATLTANDQIVIGDPTITDVVIGAYNLASLSITPETILYANLPAAGANTWRIYMVTDIGIGGSLWFSDGSRWKPVGGRVTLDVANTLPVVTGTVETITHQYTIPAGLLQDGDVLVLERHDNKSAAVETLTSRARLGTTGTTADALISANGGAATDYALLSKLMRTSNTVLTVLTIGANSQWKSPYTQLTAGDSVTVPNMQSNNLILSQTMVLSVGAETTYISTLRISIETE